MLDGAINCIGADAKLEVKSSSIAGIVSRNVHAITHQEAGNLIKQLLPRYNVLMRVRQMGDEYFVHEISFVKE